VVVVDTTCEESTFSLSTTRRIKNVKETTCMGMKAPKRFREI
jgi:hypothetical protein